MKKRKNFLMNFFYSFMSMFVFAMYAVEDGAGSVEDKTEEQEKALLQKINNIIDKRLAGIITEAQFKEKLEKAGIDKDGLIGQMTAKLDELNSALEKQGLEIVKLSKGGETQKTLLDEIKANKAGIDRALNKEVKEFEFVVTKANVTRSSVANSTQALRLTDIGQLAHRKLVARDMFTVVPVGPESNGVVRYADWDEDTKVRAAAMVAEGGTFPESTAAWAEYSMTLKKIGDTIPVTEEMLRDAGRFAAELNSFLETNVAIIEDTQLTTGDNTGNNMAGYYTLATEYVAAAAGITDANIKDLIIKMAETMTSTGGSKYMPNVAFMNISDINLLRLKKDANNNYVFRNVSEAIPEITIVETNAIAANTMVLADSRFAKIYEVEGFNISVGYVGDQFKQDLMTLKARKSENLLIRTADRGAFLKETSISAALTTLAS